MTGHGRYLDDRRIPGPGWVRDPRHLAIRLARYKFVARMLDGLEDVAEVGCAEGFASRIVAQAVRNLTLFELDPAYAKTALNDCEFARGVYEHDIVKRPLPLEFDAVYMLDVIEHIHPQDEPTAIANLCRSLTPWGTLIVGAPTLEFQAHASAVSRENHVNCKTGHQFRADLRLAFRNVFLFGMQDEVVHTGHPSMSCYHFAVCTGPRWN